MSHPIPWVGLAAIVAMFVLPLLPAWLFEGLGPCKRYPRRVGVWRLRRAWTDGHSCGFEAVEPRPQRRRPLRAELRRVKPGSALARRSTRSSGIRRF